MCRIYAALARDIDQPYIWSSIHERGLYRITNNTKSIYVKIRKIDDNFQKTYNTKDAQRCHITYNEATLIMSEHYRSLLGLKTKQSYPLTIKPVHWFYYTYAAWYVPDPFLKMNAYLGLFSLLFGIISIILGIIGCF